MGSKNDRYFITIPIFCPHCGVILPLIEEKKFICNACKNNWASKAFRNEPLEMKPTIHFNPLDAYVTEERLCPQCENEKMSYTTLQMKLVDDGPTIFYACPKCRYIEAENYYY